MKLGQVWPRREIPAWRPGDPIEDAQVFETVGTDALKGLYETDAHFVPYYIEGELWLPRMYKDLPSDYPIRFDIIPLDCEAPGHESSEAWRANFRRVMDYLGWSYYETRGGARALMGLDEPLDRVGFLAAQSRAAHLLASHGVDVDAATLGQWTRCYRLPFVNRDGVQQCHRAGRLNAIKPMSISSLPGIEWVDSKGRSVVDVPLPLDVSRAGEGGRNALLIRHAGALRNQGLGGAALLEELLAVNERVCDPPLGSREVAEMARKAERQWGAGARSEPELIENDEPLALDDEVTVARRLLSELPADTVGDRGMLWSYADDLGVWRSRDGDDLARRAARFSGFPVAAGVDKNGNEKFKPLRLRDSTCKGIANIALREHRTPGFFNQELPGIAFVDGFFGAQGLVPHAADHRARVAFPFEYVPDAKPEMFLTFLRQIWANQADDTEELIELMRQVIGVFAFGSATSFQRAFIFKGDGANGKSVLLDVIRALFPDNGAVTSISPQEWGDEYRRARLARSIINLVSELPEVRMMASEKVKGIISGDTTEGRAIYGSPFDFKPQAGHIFSANALPGVNDHSGGFWRRWLVVPFYRVFASHEQDRGLTQRLIESQRALILSWAADSVAGVLAAGDYTVPACCLAETSAWRVRADQISCFMDEDSLICQPSWTLSASQIYNRYVEWARVNNHRQLSNRIFGERIKQAADISYRRVSTGGEYTRSPITSELSNA